MLIQYEKWKEPLPPPQSSAPRKNSEDWHSQRYRLDTDTSFVEEKWIYDWWTKDPPEAFRWHKTLFRQCTPSEISKNGWRVLEPAVGEMHTSLGAPKPKDENKGIVSMWLALNRYSLCPCLVGLYGNEYVAAAAKTTRKRVPFVPCNFYQSLHKDRATWRNLRYRASYRHFQAHFDTGHSFQSAKQDRLCKVTYVLDIGVHGHGVLWAAIKVDDVSIPAPTRISLATDLSDLPDRVWQMNEICQAFIQKIGTSWLSEVGAENVYRLIRDLTKGIAVPVFFPPGLDLRDYVTTLGIKDDPQLDRCTTRLDVMLAVMAALNLKSDDRLQKLMPLSQNFVSVNQKSTNRKEHHYVTQQ